MFRLSKPKSNKANSLNLYLRVIYIKCKSQNINPISPTRKFTLGIIEIIIKSLSTIFSAWFNKIYLSVQFQYLTFQPNPKVRGVCKVKVFASMLVDTSSPLI